MDDYSVTICLADGGRIFVPVVDGAESYEVSGEGIDIYVV